MGRDRVCVAGSHPACSGRVTVRDERRRESPGGGVRGKELGDRGSIVVVVHICCHSLRLTS